MKCKMKANYFLRSIRLELRDWHIYASTSKSDIRLWPLCYNLLFFFSVLRYEHCILKMLYQAKSSSTQTFQDPFIHSFMLYFSYFWMPLHPSAFCVNSSPAEISVQFFLVAFCLENLSLPQWKKMLKVNFGLDQIIRNENSLSMINDSVTK